MSGCEIFPDEDMGEEIKSEWGKKDVLLNVVMSIIESS